MEIIADLHIHSKYSRATSKKMDLKDISYYGSMKGLNLIGTGDFTHPKWFHELSENLEEVDRSGLFTLKHDTRDVLFLFSTEVSTVYYQNDEIKKIHHVILTPNKDTLEEVQRVSNKTGDQNKLSDTDIEIIAIALDLKKNENVEVIILTDDYSIQNLSNELNIKFESINQSGITKKFKWVSRCRGCGKKFKDNVKICPICGTETSSIVSNKKVIRFRSDKE